MMSSLPSPFMSATETVSLILRSSVCCVRGWRRPPRVPWRYGCNGLAHFAARPASRFVVYAYGFLYERTQRPEPLRPLISGTAFVRAFSNRPTLAYPARACRPFGTDIDLLAQRGDEPKPFPRKLVA